MVRDQIWPALKALGFKRTRYNFHRAVGRNWEVVNLQKSAYSDRDDLRFTVNLAVGLDRTRDDRWAEGKRPPEYKCQLRMRIGDLLNGPDSRDLWWDLDRETDHAQLGDAVVSSITTYGLPWLEAHSSDDRLRARVHADPRSIARQHLYQLELLMEAMNDRAASAALRSARQER